MPTTREIVKEFLDPIRRNNLEARRRKLGLSRVALGRILDVDPATVFRRERGPFVALWDYALRGIEAEAKEAKPILRRLKGDLDQQTFIPDQLDARGHSYTAEKMHQARRKHAQEKLAPPHKPAANKNPASPGGSGERRLRGQSSEAAVKRLADRYIPDPDRTK